MLCSRIDDTYIVNTTYKGKDDDELSLEQGSFVTALEKSLSGWWTVKYKDPYAFEARKNSTYAL